MQKAWLDINTVQKLFKIEHFRLLVNMASIVNQFFKIRHEIRSTS